MHERVGAGTWNWGKGTWEAGQMGTGPMNSLGGPPEIGGVASGSGANIMNFTRHQRTWHLIIALGR